MKKGGCSSIGCPMFPKPETRKKSNIDLIQTKVKNRLYRPSLGKNIISFFYSKGNFSQIYYE